MFAERILILDLHSLAWKSKSIVKPKLISYCQMHDSCVLTLSIYFSKPGRSPSESKQEEVAP